MGLLSCLIGRLTGSGYAPLKQSEHDFKGQDPAEAVQHLIRDHLPTYSVDANETYTSSLASIALKFRLIPFEKLDDVKPIVDLIKPLLLTSPHVAAFRKALSFRRGSISEDRFWAIFRITCNLPREDDRPFTTIKTKKHEA